MMMMGLSQALELLPNTHTQTDSDSRLVKRFTVKLNEFFSEIGMKIEMCSVNELKRLNRSI